MVEQPTISTHVLDTEHGRPAAGVPVRLYRVEAADEIPISAGVTDDDGRIRSLLDGPLASGEYRLEFSVGGHFFARVSVTFRVDDTSRSYHVPLLLAPYSMTTYRGS